MSEIDIITRVQTDKAGLAILERLKVDNIRPHGSLCRPRQCAAIKADFRFWFAPNHDALNDPLNDMVKLEDFSVMVSSYPCLTSLRRLDSCTRWKSLNLRTGRGRITSYFHTGSFCIIPSVFGSSTSPCSRCPCLGQFVVSCLMQGSAEAICGSLAALDASSVGIRLSSKNSGDLWFVLRFCGTTCFWVLPVFTYIAGRSLGMNCCMGADIILQMPCAQRGSRLAPHPDILGRFFGTEVSCVNGVRAVYKATMSLMKSRLTHFNPVGQSLPTGLDGSQLWAVRIVHCFVSQLPLSSVFSTQEVRSASRTLTRKSHFVSHGGLGGLISEGRQVPLGVSESCAQDRAVREL